jgi:drug/metabolite transporter (DMT)-like permease
MTVFALVMLAALLHASWNAIVKSAPDKFLTTMMVSGAAAALSAACLPFLTQPSPSSFPYAVASAFFGSAFQMNDVLSLVAWTGVLAICLGVGIIALGSRLRHREGIRLALLNALVIACYTLIDGLGVRRSGAPAAYTLWVFLLTGTPLALWVLTTRRGSFIAYLGRHWRAGLAGGAGSTASYGLALWAMTVAPIAVVAALRETSILFATLIAGVVLRERIGPRRVVSACIIAGGAAMLRLA